MGTYRIEIQAVGGHGCQRNVKSGEVLESFCGSDYCPDCKAREFVADLKKSENVQQALLIH